MTIRLDDDTYQLIRQAAEGQLRSISNFIEFATLSYLTEEAFASDEEMEELLGDSSLVASLKAGRLVEVVNFANSIRLKPSTKTNT